MRPILSSQRVVLTSFSLVVLAIMLGLDGCGYSQQSSGAFCNPGNPGRSVSKYSDTEGTACTEQEARRKAEQAYANENCTDADDPKCSQGCDDEQQTCRKTVKYVDPPSNPSATSIMECTSRPDDSCSGGKKFTCKLRPTATVPATCSCACS